MFGFEGDRFLGFGGLHLYIKLLVFIFFIKGLRGIRILGVFSLVFGYNGNVAPELFWISH